MEDNRFLTKFFKAKLTKINDNKIHLEVFRDFHAYPSERLLTMFADDVDEGYPQTRAFETVIEVTEAFRVLKNY